MNKKKPLKKKLVRLPKHLEHINAYAAGIDVGSRSHFVAIPVGLDEEPVREFSTFTDDLERLTDWLISCGITTVAMESTGVYWIPVFEILESHGLEVKLVNARHVKNVPGRKADVLDCQWLHLWPAPRSFPAGRTDMCASGLCSTAGNIGKSLGITHSAYAESTDPDEPTVTSAV